MDSKKIIEQNKNVYDRIASLFAQTRKYLWDDLKPLKKYMRHGYRVLDIGCGTGRLYHLFKDFQGIEYTGLDQSEKQIAEAKKDFPQNTYVVAEMTDLPFNDCSFDIIYCIAAFHHLPDEKYRLKALHEMKRVSKSGHYIIMTNWNLYSKSAQKNVGSGKWEVEREIFWYHGWMRGVKFSVNVIITDLLWTSWLNCLKRPNLKLKNNIIQKKADAVASMTRGIW